MNDVRAIRFITGIKKTEGKGFYRRKKKKSPNDEKRGKITRRPEI